MYVAFIEVWMMLSDIHNMECIRLCCMALSTSALSTLIVLVRRRSSSVCSGYPNPSSMPVHTSSHSVTHSLTLSHSYPLTHSLTLTHSHTHPLTHTHSYPLTHSLTLTHSHTHPLTHTHSLTLTHTHPHSLSTHTQSLGAWWAWLTIIS